MTAVAQPDPGLLGLVPYNQLPRPHHHQLRKSHVILLQQKANALLILQCQHLCLHPAYIYLIYVSINTLQLTKYIRPLSAYEIYQNTMAHVMQGHEANFSEHRQAQHGYFKTVPSAFSFMWLVIGISEGKKDFILGQKYMEPHDLLDAFPQSSFIHYQYTLQCGLMHQLVYALVLYFMCLYQLSYSQSYHYALFK